MKKLLLSAFAVAAFGVAASAQENGGFKAGIHIGTVTGDYADFYKLNFGADVAYTFDVADKFVAGLTTGYSYYSGEEIAGETINGAFIPVAATAQYSIIPSVFVGADLGYALYVGDGDGDGGFYYQPKVGYQHEFFEVYAAYKGISVEDATVSSVNLGFTYKF